MWKKTKLILLTYTVIVLILASMMIKFGFISKTQYQAIYYDNKTFEQPTSYYGFDNKYFVITKEGLIYKVEDGKKNVYLNLTETVYSKGSEDGLLSIEFHKDFETNGYFFVFYTKFNSSRSQEQNSIVVDSIVSRFTEINGEGKIESEIIILKIPQISPWHRGGHLEFDINGLLFVNIGENSRGMAAQELDNLYGKILRINIDNFTNSKNYTIPVDNPWFGEEGNIRSEIWAYGFRNPWRSSIYNGMLFVGDVGEDSFEEIDLVKKGENHGWPVYEGNMCRQSNLSLCDNDFTFPIFVYSHNQTNSFKEPYGIAVIAGQVYQGENFPELYGKFIFSDYFGLTWSLEFNEISREIISIEFLLRFPDLIVDISLDSEDELVFVGQFTNLLYRLASSYLILGISIVIIFGIPVVLFNLKKQASKKSLQPHINYNENT